MMSQAILLKNRPKETPETKDFEFKEQQKPVPNDGEVLLKTKYVSVDPYLRGRIRDEKSYIPPFELNKPLESAIIAEVENSENENFKKGDVVLGNLKWKEFQVSNGKNVQKVDSEAAPLSAYLGILGMTGLTAYFGLTDIGRPQKRETVLVSGAAGAVGSTVGQIAKIKGCKVIGIAGSDKKIKLIKETFGFDEGINYKTTKNMQTAIQEAANKGVDVYYDNVGGEILDAAPQNMNRNGRIVNCGAIASYNKSEIPQGARVEHLLIKNSLKMQGFTVNNDYSDRFSEGIKQLSQWLQEGKITYEETVVNGFENIPQAFIDLFRGKNKGKMVVKVD